MAKKKGKRRRKGYGKVAAMDFAGEIIGNVLGQLASDAVMRYVDGDEGSGRGSKKKSSKKLRKMLKAVTSRRDS
jgi:hypothetical protein